MDKNSKNMVGFYALEGKFEVFFELFTLFNIDPRGWKGMHQKLGSKLTKV